MAIEAMRAMEADLSGPFVMCSRTGDGNACLQIMRANISPRLNESDWLEGFELSLHAPIHKS